MPSIESIPVNQQIQAEGSLCVEQHTRSLTLPGRERMTHYHYGGKSSKRHTALVISKDIYIP